MQGKACSGSWAYSMKNISFDKKLKRIFNIPRISLSVDMRIFELAADHAGSINKYFFKQVKIYPFAVFSEIMPVVL